MIGQRRMSTTGAAAVSRVGYGMVALLLSHGVYVLLSADEPLGAKAQAGGQGSPPASRVKKVPSGIDVGSVVAEEQSRIRNSRPQGEPVTVELFGGKAEGRTFVFLVDRSKSMRLGALVVAEQRLRESVKKLASHHRFQVIAYHHQCKYLGAGERKLIPGTDENKAAIDGFLKSLPAVGTTEHEMALLSGLQHAPDVLFLLTDGGDPELSEKQIAKISRLAGTRTAIHCIQFGFGAVQEPKAFLQQLAAQNRGTFRYVDVTPFMTDPS